MFDNFHLQENREGNDLTMKKSSPLESCDDFYLTNSSHDGKGNSLSPYENFLAKEELMSSNFQKKDPMSHVPSLLIDQYTELVANVKRKDFFHSLIKVGDEEEWEMKYSETYYEKVFRVFVNKKHHQKGRMIIKLNDKYCKDIYKVFFFSYLSSLPPSLSPSLPFFHSLFLFLLLLPLSTLFFFFFFLFKTII